MLKNTVPRDRRLGSYGPNACPELLCVPTSRTTFPKLVCCVTAVGACLNTRSPCSYFLSSPPQRHYRSYLEQTKHQTSKQDPGTGSVSSSSTGRIAADVLSHPTTVSAESDFSLSEVFAGAVSPAGLAAAAAASSAADLFRSQPGGGRASGTGAAAAQALTPRARTGGGEFGGGSSSSPPIRAGAGRVVAAVAEAAAETAAEEEEARRGAKRKADEAAAAAAATAARRLATSPPPISTSILDTDEKQPHGEDEPSPPAMQGASLPGRLKSPQVLSPTTPTGAESASAAAPPAQAAATARVSRTDATGAAGRLGLTLSSHNDVSPSGVMLSPGTDSEPGSSPSPELLVRPGQFSGDAAARGAGAGYEVSAEAREAGAAAASAAEAASPYSPWVTTQAGARAAQKEEEAGYGVGGGGPGSAGSAATQEPAPSPEDAQTVSISPQSASSSSVGGSSLWRPTSSSGVKTFPRSMGGQGAEEARGGLLAARSGKMRALGTLDLMQVM